MEGSGTRVGGLSFQLVKAAKKLVPNGSKSIKSKMGSASVKGYIETMKYKWFAGRVIFILFSLL